ncbi:unnamed protein product, partial [Ectocarpus sp. 12 AP-2014]
FHEGEFDEIGVPSGYLNSKGDTIIPIEKYYYCYTDTIRDFGMVIERETGKIIGIDENATELFEVFKYDNGPDFSENGIIRIIKNGKIGYANSKGEIVVEPYYKYASRFINGTAKVSNNEINGCENPWFPSQYIEIDLNGTEIKK